MKLEVGKFYKTRDGRKVGPMYNYPHVDGFCWSAKGHNDYHNDAGRSQLRDIDLIAPWHTEPTGPVRTVTRTTREIVPGEYDGLEVGRAVNGMVFLAVPIANFGREQIETLIDNLGAVRDALEDGE